MVGDNNQFANFVVTFNPSTRGVKDDATLEITSNDPDKSPFNIALTATAIAPDIVVNDPDGDALPHEDADAVPPIPIPTVILPSTPVFPAIPFTSTFTIENDGVTADLTITRITSDSTEFVVGAVPAPPGRPANATSLTAPRNSRMS